MSKERQFKKSDILRFVLLPGIKPRIAELVGHGFHFVPFLIATIFQSVRLLPAGHPYLSAQNMGRYGMRHVIAEAANNLVLDKRNIDQLLVFGLIILAMILVLMQIVMVFVALFMQPSFAGPFPSNFSQFFIPGAYPSTVPQERAQDLALILLDMVFGVPEMFLSCVDQSVGVACESASTTPATPILMSTNLEPLITAGRGGPSIGSGSPQVTHWAAWPYPIHDGIHQLFAVYSYGLLIIAMLITIYFIIVVIAETAQTGTAFGKRFNKVWVPLRIVVAFGLLVPLTIGLNSGQYIVLYAAKFGTGFASNGWAYFNEQISTHYSESMGALVSVPNQPEFAGLAQFFTVAATCKALYMRDNYSESETDDRHIVAYLVRNQTDPTSNFLPIAGLAGDDIPSEDDIRDLVPYDDLVNAATSFGYKSSRLILRFGHRNTRAFSDYLGNVKPICGEVVLSLQDNRPIGTGPNNAQPGPEIIQRFYWWLVKALWFTEGRLNTTVAPAPNNYHIYFACNALGINISATATGTCPSTAVRPPNEFAGNLLEALNTEFNQVLMGDGGPDSGAHGEGAILAQRDSGRWEVPAEMMEKGWAGAAMWYNRIAEMNGAVTAATFAIPMPSLYPEIMEFVKRQKEQHEMRTSGPDIYAPVIGGTQSITFQRDGVDFQYAQGMNTAYKYWIDQNSAASSQVEPSGNIIIDAINFIFGTQGMFDMRKNADVNPLAQLVGLGRSMIETSIRNIGYMAVGTTVGAAASMLQGLEFIGALANTLSGFLVTAATVSMTAGFVLYYILPFLPFIYFFFAVSGWIKGIFEAMVGVPLWALAHIRIDGEGLPGQAALSGYFLILEIFLRPILILFGFIGSILIFSAMVQTLNDIFDLVVANVGGFDMHEEINDTAGTGIEYMQYYRGTVDELFFTIIYVMIVFMMAQSCFKLVDQVPNNILRWMNQNVSSFNDNRADATQGLMQTAQVGAQQATSKLGGGLQKISGYLTS